MEANPTRMCELLVGLPDVNALGVDDQQGLMLHVVVETKLLGPVGCLACGSIATVKDRADIVLIDLPSFGRPTRLIWRKRRWRCSDPDCEKGSWTEEHRRIAYPRIAMTDRAGRPRWSLLATISPR